MPNKKALENASNAFVEEHLENSSPLIIAELARWHDLIWDDWLDHLHEQKAGKKL